MNTTLKTIAVSAVASSLILFAHQAHAELAAKPTHAGVSAATKDLPWATKMIVELKNEMTALKQKVHSLEDENTKLKLMIGATNLNSNLGEKSIKASQAELAKGLTAASNELAATKTALDKLKDKFAGHTHGYQHADLKWKTRTCDSASGQKANSYECSFIYHWGSYSMPTSTPK